MIPGPRIFERVRDLPADWDRCAAGNPHLNRFFLQHAEHSHPCDQRYVVFRDPSNSIDAILVWHRQSVNLFTLAGLPLSWRVTINCVSPPASVSDPGFASAPSARARIRSYLETLPGLTVILNLDAEFAPFPAWVALPLLPGFVLPLAWKSFGEYLSGMRSSYRRRCRLALNRSLPLVPRVLEDNAAQFTGDMYRLYEQVHDRAAHKLEKLTHDYFAGKFGRIVVFEDRAGRARGFAQTYRDGDIYTFGFGGLDYSVLTRFDTYQRILLWIIEDAIKSGCRVLKLGQTAEDAKCRLGAVPIPLNLNLRHSHPLVQACFRKIAFLLAKASQARAYHVFHDRIAPTDKRP